MSSHVPSHTHAPPSRPDLETRIERLAVLIAGARRLIAEGQALDLAVLGFATADLRDAVCRAPTEATAGLAPRVVALQAALDGLAEDLAVASGTAARGVSASARRSAFRAYPGGNDGRGDDRQASVPGSGLEPQGESS